MTEKLPEAPASVNFKGVTKNGWLCQWTLRDFDEGALLERQGKFIERLIEGEVVPYPRGIPAPVNGKPVSQATPEPVTPPTPTPAPVQPFNVPVEEQGTQTFDAELLVGSTSGDKVYWKVQGGQFSQYGVTIWPEVLEAAEITNLDPTQTYDLTGYTAYYTLKDNGKPGKVVNLAK